MLEREELIPLPTPTCGKITVRVWETVGFQRVHGKQLVPYWPFPMQLLFIAKFKDQARNKKALCAKKLERVVNSNTLKVSLCLQ